MKSEPTAAPSQRTRRAALSIAAVLGVLVAWMGCGGNGRGVRSVEEIVRSGKLVVLTRNAPTTCYVDRDGEMAGPEYDMVVSFAAHLGVEPEIRMLDTISEILEAIAAGGGDVAAAGLTETAARAEDFRTGPVYQTVRQLVVTRRGGEAPRTLDDLARVGLRVVAGSSYEERLRELDAQHPGLVWRRDAERSTEQLLELVWRGEIEGTICDDNIFRINRRYYPELISTMSITQPESLAWFVNRDNGELAGEIGRWYAGFEARGERALVEEKYYGFVEIFDYVDMRKFMRRIETDLPRYRRFFEEAARDNRLDWILLAALSYQESHWRPRAQSPTGVKGIMMLTQPAARDVGVTDRLDPEQSIRGGARYLRQMIDRLPRGIEEPDRTWIALAAYNVGMGHMHDARALARRLGRDPDVWADLQRVLPLLAKKEYYKTLRYGYARGNEPVLYVERIRNYEDILRRAID